MSHSWRSVHYVQRPAKNIERKMIAEAIGRLERLRPMIDFAYVGFGSIYFADFALLHRNLGLRKMISIEKHDEAVIRERFEFNKPYDAIELMWGEVNDVLPALPWAEPLIIWLDFDSPLGPEHVAALQTVVAHAPSPALLIYTALAEPGRVEGRIARLSEAAGDIAVPQQFKDDDDLIGWGMADAVWAIASSAVHTANANEQGTKDEADRLRVEQVFRFHYKDNAKMLTVGWLLYDPSLEASVLDCRLSDLDFVRSNADDPFKIIVPNITHRERAALEQRLPGGSTEDVPIPVGDRANFEALYRHYPGFVDAVF